MTLRPLSSAPGELEPRRYIARWDLDKTYLRTDFDTLRDLLRTAVERPDQKRTVPGAAALLRELGRAGVETHILSGSPEQLRGRIEEKLKLDGVRYASLTLKPNLENLLRLRFRALRGQLGYKLPSLLLRRCEMGAQREGDGELVREVLLGDDAEADAFVYCLYADICRGAVDEQVLADVLREGGAYEDSIKDSVRFAKYIEKGEVVERVLIHLDRQSSPSEFRPYGSRVVPFYNYLQAAFVVHEDGRLPADGVLRVAAEMVTQHRFDGSALARSYHDLGKRGHLRGSRVGELTAAFEGWDKQSVPQVKAELRTMLTELPVYAEQAGRRFSETEPPMPDYLTLVGKHNRRRHKKK